MLVLKCVSLFKKSPCAYNLSLALLIIKFDENSFTNSSNRAIAKIMKKKSSFTAHQLGCLHQNLLNLCINLYKITWEVLEIERLQNLHHIQTRRQAFCTEHVLGVRWHLKRVNRSITGVFTNPIFSSCK